MIGFSNDVRTAVRGLLRSPGFTAATVFALALGIGAATAIFSVVNGVLVRPLPLPEPDALMQLRHVHEDGSSQTALSYPNFADLREASRSFEAMGAYAATEINVTGGGRAERLTAVQATEGFFETLGVAPALGRTFEPGELGVEGATVAVVGHGLWTRRFEADPDLGGAVVRVGGRDYDVVGVMPEGFAFPAGAEVWTPSPAFLTNQARTGHNFEVIARLEDGVDRERAQREASAIAGDLADRHGEDTWMADAAVIPLHDELVGPVRPALGLLFGAAGLLLLIACANVTNLLLARNVARRRELSIRRALGAGRRRLMGHYLTETLALSLAGAALGVVLAILGVSALQSLQPPGLPRVEEVGVDWTVLLFALVVSVAVALGIGLLPALRSIFGKSDGAVPPGRRAAGTGGSAGRARNALAAGQIALSLVLLIGAGLLARSFVRLLDVDPGFRTDDAVVMELWLPATEGQAAEPWVARFHDDVLARIGALPGVEEAGGVSLFPLSGRGGGGTFAVLDGPEQVEGLQGLESFDELARRPELMRELQRLFENPERTGYAEFRVASEGYFRAMGIPLLRGRTFESRDRPDAPHVAVISRSLAESRWPDEDPIGEVVEFGNMDGDLRPLTIVGVVDDVRERGLEAEPRPTFYGNALQRPNTTYHYHLVFRGAADPATMMESARRAVGEVNPEVAVRVRTLDRVLAASLADRRFSLFLLGVFGGVALLLAMLGIYSVISYLVSQRRREIGIRMALGATEGAVRRMVVFQGGALAVAGAVLGLLAGGGLSSLTRSFLYGVTTSDPVTYAGAAAFVVAVALGASWIPAARAAAVEPTRALKTE